MRKAELIYLHQLLTAVRREYERRGDTTPAVFSAYDELSISPVAVHERKASHEQAVLRLAAALADCSAAQVGSDTDQLLAKSNG